MRLLYDTNIILDVLFHRGKLETTSAAVLHLSEAGEVEGFVGVTSLTDIFYLAHQASHSKEDAYAALDFTLQILSPLTTGGEDALRAFATRSADFEDAVLAMAAEREGCDYILTRNKKDFKSFPLPVLTPEELLARFP